VVVFQAIAMTLTLRLRTESMRYMGLTNSLKPTPIGPFALARPFQEAT
jgi:hypothetical protein